MGTGTGTQTRTTWVTAIALLVLRTGELIKQLKILTPITGEKSATFMRRKISGQKKGNDKQKDAASLLHITTNQIQCLYELSES